MHPEFNQGWTGDTDRNDLYKFNGTSDLQPSSDEIKFENSGTASSSGQDSVTSAGLFQCGFCQKKYNRADHLQRHVRSHSGEKPYSCEICFKKFGRPDLLKRHAEGHAVDRDGGSKRRKLVHSRPPAPTRVSQACKACSASKLRCDENKPCTRCSMRGLNCEPVSQPNTQSGDTAEEQLLPHQKVETPSLTTSKLSLKADDQLPTPASSQASHSNALSENVLESEYGFYPDFFGVDWAASRTIMAAADYVNEGRATISGPLGGPGYASQESFDWGNPNFNSQSFKSSLQSLESETSFTQFNETRRQSSEWTPALVSLPPGIPPKARRKPRETPIHEPLTNPSRDKILSLVIQNSRPENIDKIVGSFPSTELFDDFMQHFFNNFSLRVDDWIHLGTFRPNECIPELLVPIIGTGLVYDEQHVLRTVGYSMQEVTRIAIPKGIDVQDPLVRIIHMQQAYMLQLEALFYSASRQKVEAAESAFQFGLTMLRRNRQFRSSEYSTIYALVSDEGAVLEEKWKQWAKQEERKRTAFHTVIHDASQAMMVNTAPLISYTELGLPLPESEALWRAKTALEWKKVQMTRSQPLQTPLPSLLDALQDLSCLMQYLDYLDINLTLFAILHTLWSLIVQHRQLRSLSSQIDWVNPTSVAFIKCDDLLASIQLVFNNVEVRPEVLAMHAYMEMSLQISNEVLHLFAGREEKETAQRVYYSARHWIESPSSRKAIWYAGQVLQHARRFRGGTLRDIYCSIMYHVSLVFWTYGVLIRAHQSATPAAYGSSNQRPLLALDDPEVALSTNGFQDTLPVASLAHIFFQDASSATPVIRHHKANLIGLDDPTVVLDEVQHCLRANFGQGPPELVKATRRLISDLGSAARLGTAKDVPGMGGAGS